MAISETKVRIPDVAALEARLVFVGAAFITQHRVTDTYFRQKQDRVIKLTEREGRTEVTRLRKGGNRFLIESKEPVEDVKEQLMAELGVHHVIRKLRKTFAYDDHTVHVDEIEGLGPFLVIEGERAHDILRALQLGNETPIHDAYSDVTPERPALR